LRELAGSLRNGLDAVTMKAISKQRRDRYASCAEFADDLRRFLAGEPVSAKRVGIVRSVWAHARRFRRRHPAALSLIAGCLLGAVTLIGIAAAITKWQMDKLTNIVKRTEPDDQRRATDMDSAMEHMAAHLRTASALAQGGEGRRISLHIGEIHNDTPQMLDKRLLETKLRTSAFKAFGRQARVLTEPPQRDAKQTPKEVFVLRSTVRAAEAASPKSAMLDFELSDVATDAVVWTGSCDMEGG
jgi:hypothetical protein